MIILLINKRQKTASNGLQNIHKFIEILDFVWITSKYEMTYLDFNQMIFGRVCWFQIKLKIKLFLFWRAKKNNLF